jgi:hypothetical protein
MKEGTNVMTEGTALLLPIREVPDCSLETFPPFRQLLAKQVQSEIALPHLSSSPYNSLFINDSKISCYIG